jgi:hypothetical protein
VNRRERGDWQTPLDLARSVLARVRRVSGGDRAPATIVEPTCGAGAFLVAASEAHPSAQLVGYEIDPGHARAARTRLPRARSRVTTADFFEIAWERELSGLAEPILVTGNPPWVTSSVLGTLGSTNLPGKTNFKSLRGLEALTGKSNFDVSEWMVARLAAALQGRDATLAMLCKAAVARRVIELAEAMKWRLSPGGIWRIDAMRHFGAAVDAVLFVARASGSGDGTWPVYASLDDEAPVSTMAMASGVLVADADAFDRTAHLEGECAPEWRSGLKHDCARVMELSPTSIDGTSTNGLGERVRVEDEHVFPLLKSSDIARGKGKGVACPSRSVIVPQRTLAEDTSRLKHGAPKLWRYLSAHRELFAARKSRIYRGRPAFAIFGVGPYSFAPWKVAVSGLYKHFEPMLVGPYRGRPVMLDDTCYFLPFDSEAAAARALAALRSPLARDFVAARVFWDAKRPINKAILQRLDLRQLRGSRRSPRRVA